MNPAAVMLAILCGLWAFVFALLAALAVDTSTAVVYALVAAVGAFLALASMIEALAE